jgi:hypothetical protein
MSPRNISHSHRQSDRRPYSAPSLLSLPLSSPLHLHEIVTNKALCTLFITSAAHLLPQPIPFTPRRQQPPIATRQTTDRQDPIAIPAPRALACCYKHIGSPNTRRSVATNFLLPAPVLCAISPVSSIRGEYQLIESSLLPGYATVTVASPTPIDLVFRARRQLRNHHRYNNHPSSFLSTDRGRIPSQHPQHGGIRTCPDFRHYLRDYEQVWTSAAFCERRRTWKQPGLTATSDTRIFSL